MDYDDAITAANRAPGLSDTRRFEIAESAYRTAVSAAERYGIPKEAAEDVLAINRRLHPAMVADAGLLRIRSRIEGVPVSTLMQNKPVDGTGFVGGNFFWLENKARERLAQQQRSAELALAGGSAGSIWNTPPSSE